MEAEAAFAIPHFRIHHRLILRKKENTTTLELLDIIWDGIARFQLIVRAKFGITSLRFWQAFFGGHSAHKNHWPPISVPSHDRTQIYVAEYQWRTCLRCCLLNVLDILKIDWLRFYAISTVKAAYTTNNILELSQKTNWCSLSNSLVHTSCRTLSEVDKTYWKQLVHYVIPR